ncbi:MAG: phytoene/squalene synthase family protein [Akkermansiaceae bacterium]|jgi:farnesyl-diphosphate farnesyltransferase
MHSGLDTQVLKDVSRSFYLSLRFLPKNFRPAASLGYLLARASDTFADAPIWSVEERKELLQEFRQHVLKGGNFTAPENTEGLPDGERVLLDHLDDCMRALAGLSEAEQKSIRKVVGIITEGQTWDLVRFDGSGVTGLKDDAELRHYTYQVAGCVGEFWTEIGFATDDDFATRSQGEMNELGQAYGRSLQLINILRDVPEDLANGRIYLPNAMSREELMSARGPWIEEALAGLASAGKYAAALNGKRMRFGTILPALIGRETLLRLQESSWEEWEKKVKVTRAEVRGMMWQGVKFAL